MLFGRRAAELEPVPPARVASAQDGDGPGTAPVDAPAARGAEVPARHGVRPASRIRAGRLHGAAAATQTRRERALR